MIPVKCIKIYIINLKRVSINRAIFADVVPDDFHYDWSQHCLLYTSDAADE